MFSGQYVCHNVHIYKQFVGVQILVYLHCNPKGMRMSANYTEQPPQIPKPKLGC